MASGRPRDPAGRAPDRPAAPAEGDAHWGDGYYGELYLASVEGLLTPRLTSLEAEALSRLLALRARDAVLDLGCGHGRHARVLAGWGARIVGLDRSGPYLRAAVARAPERGARPVYVRGDVRALPFADGSFDAAFSWYASLFMFDDRTNEACLAEMGRVVRPGGRVVVHHANPLRLSREGRAEARRSLPDGTVVEETSEWDAVAGVDRCARRVMRPGEPVLAATAQLRYYMPSEWGRLAGRAGLRLLELTTTPDAGRSPPPELGPEAPDLIALLETPT